jgi:hypothetical protein
LNKTGILSHKTSVRETAVIFSLSPNIIAINALFLDAALIILLSDKDEETFDMAISRRPKFVGMMNSDMDKIRPIVQKLVQKIGASSPNTRRLRARSSQRRFDLDGSF